MLRRCAQFISILIGLFFLIVLAVGLDDTISEIQQSADSESIAVSIVSCIFVAAIVIVFIFIVPRKIPKGKKDEQAQISQAEIIKPQPAPHDIQISVQPESPPISKSPVKVPTPVKPQPEPEKAERKKPRRIAGMTAKEKQEIRREYSQKKMDAIQKNDYWGYRYWTCQAAMFERKAGEYRMALILFVETINWDLNGCIYYSDLRYALNNCPEKLVDTEIAFPIIKDIGLCQKALAWTDDQLKAEIIENAKSSHPLVHFLTPEDIAQLFFANRDGNERKKQSIKQSAITRAKRQYPQLNFYQNK